MKKLMIAASLVCAAALAQAAAVSWQSDVIYKPADATGKYSTTAKMGSKAATGYVWELKDLTDDQGAIIKTAAQIWTEYESDPSKIYSDWKAGTLGTETKTAQSTMQGKISMTGTTAYSEGDTAYALILYTYTDADSKDWYVANAAKYEGIGTADALVSALNLYEGGKIGTNPQGDAITGWTAASGAVPEPTSAMLMLLGVAGLMLKRKRA